MLILRIRQAEVAAGAGRLDEAYEIVAKDARFRSHRRGQETIARLVSAFVQRGREHLASGRIPQAGTDCEKAGKLGGDLPDVVQLRSDLAAAHDDRRRHQRDAAVAVAAARRHVEVGALSVGQRLIADVDDSRARRLMTDIDDHRSRLEAALAHARAAQDRRDWSAAADAVSRARAITPADAHVAELEKTIGEAIAQQAQSELETGRLDRAADSTTNLRRADPDSSIAREIDRALEHCQRAWECLGRAKPHEAAESLRRVSVLFPKAKWIPDAIKHLDAACEAMTQLRAGPLSFVADLEESIDDRIPEKTTRPLAPMAVHRGAPMAPELPERFILQVDGGAGAFLVVRSGIVKVGPISSAGLPDVALVADATAPAISIERVEDDYFLRAPSPVAVNDRPVTESLLGSGDRIGLSPRCRFTFAIPNAASTTAVLDLVGARYPRGDVRRVVLLDRDIILGDGTNSHVRVSGLPQPVVLNLRNGLLRASVPASVNGKTLGREEGLPVGVPISAGGASFVISRV